MKIRKALGIGLLVVLGIFVGTTHQKREYENDRNLHRDRIQRNFSWFNADFRWGGFKRYVTSLDHHAPSSHRQLV